jgi:hypothetical protein
VVPSRTVTDRLLASVRTGTTFSGQWEPAHRLRREPFLTTGEGIASGVAVHQPVRIDAELSSHDDGLIV